MVNKHTSTNDVKTTDDNDDDGKNDYNNNKT